MATIRIAFDARPGTGGPPRYVASLVRALAAPGWSVEFVENRRPLSVAPTPAPRPGVGPGTATMTKSRPRLSRLVPRFARNWLGFRREASRLSSAIRATPVDIFHTQHTGCEEMPVAARLAGVPHVLGTFHVDSTYDLERERSGFAHRAMEWYSNRSLHMAIAVSEATKRDWMQRTGIPSERVVTIHNGIDPDHFVRRQSKIDARLKLGLPQDAIILGGLGRLDAAKGFAYLIEAVAILRSEFPKVMAVIAGAGPLREVLEAKSQTLGVSDRVVFLGFQSEVNLVLDACDVFVLTSLCEALPFALLEAMAHALPVVGTAVGGVPEVIVPAETGFLSPARDAGVLAAATKPLLASPELRERFGHAGRARVIKHFHEADMVRKTIDLYRQMLSDHQLASKDRSRAVNR